LIINSFILFLYISFYFFMEA